MGGSAAPLICLSLIGESGRARLSFFDPYEWTDDTHEPISLSLKSNQSLHLWNHYYSRHHKNGNFERESENGRRKAFVWSYVKAHRKKDWEAEKKAKTFESDFFIINKKYQYNTIKYYVTFT